MAAGAGCGQGAGVRDAPYVLQAAGDDVVGAVLDPGGRLRTGGAAARRVVLETAVGGRVVRGGDHHAVGEAGRAVAVVGEDGVRDRRGGRVAVRLVDQDGHVVGGEHLQCRDPRGLGQCVGVGAEEEGAVGALGGAVLADGLAGGRDVVLVERRREGRTAVSRRPERHPLPGLGRVGVQRVVRRDQTGHIDEVLGPGDLPRSRVLHFPAPPLRSTVGYGPHSPLPGPP